MTQVIRIIKVFHPTSNEQGFIKNRRESRVFSANLFVTPPLHKLRYSQTDSLARHEITCETTCRPRSTVDHGKARSQKRIFLHQLDVAMRLTRTILPSVKTRSKMRTSFHRGIKQERRRSIKTITRVASMSQTGIHYRPTLLPKEPRRVTRRIPASLHPLRRLTTFLFPLGTVQGMAPEVPATKTASDHPSNPTSILSPRRDTCKTTVEVIRARPVSISPCQGAQKLKLSTSPPRRPKSLVVS